MGPRPLGQTVAPECDRLNSLISLIPRNRHKMRCCYTLRSQSDPAINMRIIKAKFVRSFFASTPISLMATVEKTSGFLGRFGLYNWSMTMTWAWLVTLLCEVVWWREQQVVEFRNQTRSLLPKLAGRCWFIEIAIRFGSHSQSERQTDRLNASVCLAFLIALLLAFVFFYFLPRKLPTKPAVQTTWWWRWWRQSQTDLTWNGDWVIGKENGISRDYSAKKKPIW